MREAEGEKGKMRATVVEANEKVVTDENENLGIIAYDRGILHVLHSHYFTLFLFSSLCFVFGIWRSNVSGFMGGFNVKFIADFGCEISWVGCVLQRDSVGFFGLFKGVS